MKVNIQVQEKIQIEIQLLNKVYKNINYKDTHAN